MTTGIKPSEGQFEKGLRDLAEELNRDCREDSTPVDRYFSFNATLRRRFLPLLEAAEKAAKIGTSTSFDRMELQKELDSWK